MLLLFIGMFLTELIAGENCVIMLESLRISMLVTLDGIWGNTLQILGKVRRASVVQHVCLRPKEKLEVHVWLKGYDLTGIVKVWWDGLCDGVL